MCYSSWMKDKCNFENCEERKEVREWCRPHYKKWLRGPDVDRSIIKSKANPKDTLIERLNYWGWTVSQNNCWIWDGRKDQFGYGMFKFKSNQTRAHRAMWEHANSSEIPEGMVILHSCDTPSCVNPDHLTLGTQADNVADMVNKGRAIGGGSYDPRIVLKVKEEYRAGGVTKKSLEAKYGMSGGQVTRITKGQIWAWLETEEDLKNFQSREKCANPRRGNRQHSPGELAVAP